MKIKFFITTIILFISFQGFSQVTVKGKWFFGVEAGYNTIFSLRDFPENRNSPQGGLFTEYYFAKHWSLTGRLKYFKTGVSSEDGVFLGKVISVPINIKLQYPIFKNFSGFLKTGFALNQEIESNYYYFSGKKTNYSSFFGTFNLGFGFNYFFNSNTAIYSEIEFFILGNIREEDKSSLGLLPNSTNNAIYNIGIKHSFGR